MSKRLFTCPDCGNNLLHDEHDWDCPYRYKELKHAEGDETIEQRWTITSGDEEYVRVRIADKYESVRIATDTGRICD